MRKLIVVFLVVFMGCQPKNDLPIVQKIHSNWIFKSKNSDNWHTATVPGNVYSDLLDNDLIPDPFVKNNEEKVQWVSDSSWIYKTNFSLDKDILKKKHIELDFDGLDTYARVFLNDSLILNSTNAFRKFSVDVKEILKEENSLWIELESTKIHEEKEKKKLNYELPEGNRVFTRKAQFQYGWDWGPKLNASGIWKDVSLKAWNRVKVNEIFLKQVSINKDTAATNVEIKFHNETYQDILTKVFVNNRLYKEIETDENSLKIPIKIKNPKLWWPHNLGDPYLYDVEVQFYVNNKLVDKKNLKHGIRKIELVADKDSIGQSFYFKVNGVPVYAKGANYIPQNSLQNKISKKHYQKLLGDVVDANMNILRVWGGGIYENDIFYDLCDEKGILVWQDFMFACAMYPGDRDFLNNIQAEAENQIKRLRNHSSIALWCGNNENSEGWHRWGWQSGKTVLEKEKIWNDYIKAFKLILPNMVAKHSTTSYWESSPKFGRGNPKYKTEGDAHDWWIWHDAYPFEHLEKNVPRFMSEFGFQSFPSFETINYINQNDSIDIHSEAMKSHQKHSRGFQLIEEYMKRDYPIPSKDEDYMYVSQLLQAKGIVMGIEAQRRAKPYNMGTLYWQLNDCWPAISWSSIDYFGNWKALHFKAKKAFQNILISTTKSKYDYDTYIINDSLKDISGTLKLKMIDFYGKEIWSNSKEINVKANSSQKVYHIPQVDIYKAGYVYVIEFKDSKSYYYFDKPKNLKLPKSKIQYEVKSSKGGFTISLTSDVLEKDVFLFTNAKGHFSDNFFDILPNETVEIHFISTAKEIDDLKIKTLNQLLSYK